MTIGIIIGRFQVPELTRGHRELIQRVRMENDRVVVFIGQHDVKSTRRYPLVWTSVSDVLHDYDPEILVHPIYDKSSNGQWSEDVDKIIDHFHPDDEVTLYGGRDSFINSYFGKYPTKEVLDIYNDGPSGTEVRKAVRPPMTKEGRKGAIWATHNTYPAMISVVDAVIVDQKHNILLCRKPGAKVWGFIGGFVDPTDESLNHAIVREVAEETGLGVIPIYQFSMRIDERRYAKELDTMMTHVFKCSLMKEEQVPKAQDDVAEVKWFPSHDLPELLPNHKLIFEKIIARAS